MRILSLLLTLLLSLSAAGQVKVISQAPNEDVLHISTTQAGTTAVTTEETLWTWNLAANKIPVGEGIRVFLSGTFAANANTKTVKFKFGSTSRTINSVNTAPNSATWTAEFIIIRTAASAQLMILNNPHVGQVVQYVATDAPTADMSAAVALAVTGQNGTASANDILFRSAIVTKY